MPDSKFREIIDLALEIIEDNAARRRFLRELETREILSENDLELIAEIAKTKQLLGEKNGEN